MEIKNKLMLEIKRLKEDITISHVKQLMPYINGKEFVGDARKHLLEHINLIELLAEDLEVQDDKIQT